MCVLPPQIFALIRTDLVKILSRVRALSSISVTTTTACEQAVKILPHEPSMHVLHKFYRARLCEYERSSIEPQIYDYLPRSRNDD